MGVSYIHSYLDPMGEKFFETSALMMAGREQEPSGHEAGGVTCVFSIQDARNRPHELSECVTLVIGELSCPYTYILKTHPLSSF